MSGPSSILPQLVTATDLPLPAGAATAALQTTGNTSLGDIDVNTAPLNTAQGATGTTVAGPMVQALANDSPPYRITGMVYPLSMTPDGRLRVASAPSTADYDFWPDPFAQTMTDAPAHAFMSTAVSFF